MKNADGYMFAVKEIEKTAMIKNKRLNITERLLIKRVRERIEKRTDLSKKDDRALMCLYGRKTDLGLIKNEAEKND